MNVNGAELQMAAELSTAERHSLWLVEKEQGQNIVDCKKRGAYAGGKAVKLLTPCLGALSSTRLQYTRYLAKGKDPRSGRRLASKGKGCWYYLNKNTNKASWTRPVSVAAAPTGGGKKQGKPPKALASPRGKAQAPGTARV